MSLFLYSTVVLIWGTTWIAIYWQLGKVNMVQKLLELQLKATQDPAMRAALLRELGDVLLDQGAEDPCLQERERQHEMEKGRAARGVTAPIIPRYGLARDIRRAAASRAASAISRAIAALHPV